MAPRDTVSIQIGDFASYVTVPYGQPILNPDNTTAGTVPDNFTYTFSTFAPSNPWNLTADNFTEIS
jgi:hypothetical protein